MQENKAAKQIIAKFRIKYLTLGALLFCNLSGPSIDHGYVENRLVTYLLQRGKGKAVAWEGFQDLVDEVTDHVELDEVTDH